MNNLQLYSIGTKIRINSELEGLIIAINIKEKNYVTYQLSWWNCGNCHDRWLTEMELEELMKEVKETVVGFR